MNEEDRLNTLLELPFVDDLVGLIIAKTKEELQERIAIYQEFLETKRIKASIKKTEVMVSGSEE